MASKDPHTSITQCKTRIEAIYTKLTSLGLASTDLPSIHNLENVNATFDKLYPDGYIPLNYIQSDGYAWINTRVTANQNHLHNVKCHVPSTDTNCGVICISNEVIVVFFRPTGVIAMWAGGRSYNSTRTDNFAKIVDIRFDVTGITVSRNDGVTYSGTTGATSFSSTATYGIFKGLAGSYFPNPIKDVRIYRYTIQDKAKNELYRDFIPVILTKSVTNVTGTTSPAGDVGMWDLVENKFYPNSGTGKFVIG